MGTRAWSDYPTLTATRDLLADELAAIYPARESITRTAEDAGSIDAVVVGRIRTALALSETLLDQLQEVRDQLVDWILEVETVTAVMDDLIGLYLAPAWSGTGDSLADLVLTPTASRSVLDGELLEDIAREITGESEDWAAIDLDPWLELAPNWTGRILQVPRAPRADQVRRATPGVWSGADGAEALGRDLARELQLVGTDLRILAPTPTLFQGLESAILTVRGSLGQNPTWGSMMDAIIGEAWGDISPQVLGIEVRRVFLADPRVASVESVEVTTTADSATVEVSFRSILGEREQLAIGA